MGAREPVQSASISKRDAMERHNRALLRALQNGHQVVYEGRASVIVRLHFLTAGGGTEVDVGLEGHTGHVNPQSIVIVDGAGSAAPASDVDALHEHNRVLLHALQIAHRVVHENKNCFIHALSFSADKGAVRSIVYLTGSPDKIAPEAITLAPKIN
jgi:hypothetical protein